MPLLVGLALCVASPDDWNRPYYPDGASDKYTALAAWTGGNPYQTMEELAVEYGFHPTGHPAPHPRPPAALLAQGPMILLPDHWIIPVMNVLAVLAVVFVFWGAAQISQHNHMWFVVAATWYLWAAVSYWYASSGLVIAPLVVGGWLLIEKRPTWAAACFGVAAAMKLWPFAIVAALITRPATRRVGLGGLAVAIGMTTVGVLLPGASIGGTLTAGREAAEFFAYAPHNTSLPGVAAKVGLPLVVGSVAAGLLWAWSVRRAVTVHQLIGWAAVTGILAAPVAWHSYWLAVLPFFALLIPSAAARREDEHPAAVYST